MHHATTTTHASRTTRITHQHHAPPRITHHAMRHVHATSCPTMQYFLFRYYFSLINCRYRKMAVSSKSFQSGGIHGGFRVTYHYISFCNQILLFLPPSLPPPPIFSFSFSLSSFHFFLIVSLSFSI